MEQDVLKRQIAGNIAFFRKQAGLTQAELAQRVNYSDKAISKWERAEGLPDVLTLTLLAEALEVSIDRLIYHNPDAPEEAQPQTPEIPETQVPQEKPRKKPVRTTLSQKRKIIAALSSLPVWFVALLAYQILSDAHLPGYWVGFLLAVPVNAIVLLSLLSAWRYYRLNQLLISVIMWGSLILVFCLFWAFLHWCLPKIFLFGIPGQLAIYLWFRMLHKEEQK